MVRLLIINSTLERSGLTNVFYNLVKHMDKSKFDIHVLTFSNEPEHSRWSDFDKLNINLHSLKLNGIRRFFFNKNIINNKIDEIAPDLIHTFSFRGNVFAARYAKKVPHFVTLQANITDNYQVDYGKLFGKIMASIELLLIKKATLITVCSNSLAKDYSFFKNVICIPNGVSQKNYFPISNDEKENLKLKYNIHSKQEIFVCTGLINERKDSLTVVKAFQNYAKPNQILFMVGKGKLLEVCKELTKECTQIKYTGMVDNVMDYLGFADFFISASLSEGMPNAVLEAGFVGLNLILSDIPPHLELKENNCSGICYFRVSNINELGTLIQNASKSEVKMATIYTAEFMAKSYEKLYNDFVL